MCVGGVVAIVFWVILANVWLLSVLWLFCEKESNRLTSLLCYLISNEGLCVNCSFLTTCTVVDGALIFPCLSITSIFTEPDG